MAPNTLENQPGGTPKDFHAQVVLRVGNVDPNLPLQVLQGLFFDCEVSDATPQADGSVLLTLPEEHSQRAFAKGGVPFFGKPLSIALERLISTSSTEFPLPRYCRVEQGLEYGLL